MIQRLDLRFAPDTDGTGELFAFAQRGDFSGAGSAWFGESAVRAFGARLQACFPLLPDAEIRLQGGVWESGSSPPRLAEVLVSIRVYPVGSTGAIGVHLELGEGVYERQRQESRARASFELIATYEGIQRFGAQLTQLPSSRDKVANLFQDEA